MKKENGFVDRVEDQIIDSTLKTLSSYPSVRSFSSLKILNKGSMPCLHGSRVNDCTLYAFRGLLRGLLVGFGMRSTFKLAIAIFSRRLFRQPLNSLINIFGSDSLRFGTFMGMMQFSFRSIQCLLCKLSGKPSSLNSAIAGFIAGWTVLIDKRERRDTISIFLFVRAVFELFRTLVYNGIIPQLPYGSVIVFALCQMAILHSFYFEPKAMNKGYYHWILRMGAVSDNLLHNTLRSTEKFTCQDVYHDHSCLHFLCTDFPHAVFVRSPPVYLPVHILPSLLFKTKFVFKYPLIFMKDVLFGVFRSCLFLGTYIAVAKSGVCFWRQFFPNNEKVYIPLLFNSLFTGLGLLFEHPKRHAELMQYCVPRALEIVDFYIMKHLKGPKWFIWAKKSGIGNVFLFCCAVALFVYAANTNPPLKSLNASVFRVIFGPSAYLIRVKKTRKHGKDVETEF